MYRSFSPNQYREHLGFAQNYTVDAMLCYGTLYEEKTLELLHAAINELGLEAEINDMPDDFLRFAKEVKVNGKVIWFAIGYGGAWLSEYIHWACLFGSKKNLLVGSSGGLKSGMKQGDFIVPESSYAEESSARIYNRNTCTHKPDEKLSEEIAERLKDNQCKIWRGPMVTCQAMIGETLEDIKQWSKKGYIGVEMEASTVFAVSEHFNVPAAASLYVGDNLIEEHSVMSEEFIAEKDMRQKNQLLQIKIALEELIS